MRSLRKFSLQPPAYNPSSARDRGLTTVVTQSAVTDQLSRQPLVNEHVSLWRTPFSRLIGNLAPHEDVHYALR